MCHREREMHYRLFRYKWVLYKISHLVSKGKRGQEKREQKIEC